MVSTAKDAIVTKQMATRTEKAGNASEACNIGLNKYAKNVVKETERLQNESMVSKGLWSSRGRKARTCGVPGFKKMNREWYMDAKSNADHLVGTLKTEYSWERKLSTNT